MNLFGAEARESAMLPIGIGVFTILALFAALLFKAQGQRRQLEQHSITAEALRALMVADREVLLFDVREPLDLLADAERIPGSSRLAPKQIEENADIVPRDKDIVVYCTCPSDKTSRALTRRALAKNFLRFKFLKGGIAAWKQKGYPVEPYRETFHLDTAT